MGLAQRGRHCDAEVVWRTMSHQLSVNQRLVTRIFCGCGGVVGCDAKPSQAMPCNLLAQQPSTDIGVDTGILQFLFSNPMLLQRGQVNRVHLCHADVFRAVGVVVDGFGVEAAFDHQNGFQELRVNPVKLRGVCNAPFNGQMLDGRLGFCLHIGQAPTQGRKPTNHQT